MTIGESVSNSMKKHLVGMYCNKKEVQRVPCFLIGQLAKSDSFGKEMNGKELISSAVTAINRVHQTVGGRFIKIDCHEEMEKVIRLYVENGFTPIQTNKNHLVEMVMFFDKLPRGKTAT